MIAAYVAPTLNAQQRIRLEAVERAEATGLATRTELEWVLAGLREAGVPERDIERALEYARAHNDEAR